VDARVVLVGELVEHLALALALHVLGQVARVFHAAALGREHQLGAEGLHGLGPLDRQVLRHDQHHAVALDGGRHRQRDAGVAGGRLDERVARLDLAALLGAADHRQGRPVLHRSGRVVAFELAQDDIASGAFSAAPMRCSATSGVLPMASSIVGYVRGLHRSTVP
jgi:hypothetical protein